MDLEIVALQTLTHSESLLVSFDEIFIPFFFLPLLIRSPEEAMFHIIQEAKRTVPSVLYIPHLLRLWRNVLSIPQREAFMALLSEIAPTAPLIIIAFTGTYGLMFKELL